MTIDPYQLGFLVAFREITDGVASYTQSKQRGLFPGDQDSRIEWDRGYDDCVCAYRLGHDVEDMIASEFFMPSVMETHAIVDGLLDGTWDRPIRPDPRRA